MEKLENYTDKEISEFNDNDTFYGVKNHNGFSYSFLLQFVKFEKGMLTGKVCGDIYPINHKSIWFGKQYIEQGSEMSFRISKCYTVYNKTRCVWFEKTKTSYKCYLKK